MLGLVRRFHLSPKSFFGFCAQRCFSAGFNQSFEERIKTLRLNEYPKFFEDLLKATDQDKVLLEIKSHLKSLKSNDIEIICKEFDLQKPSVLANEVFVNVLLSVPKLFEQRYPVFYISNLIRMDGLSLDVKNKILKALKVFPNLSNNVENLASIFRSLNSQIDLVKLSKFLQNNKSIVLYRKIFAFFHINKANAMDVEAKKHLLTYKPQFHKERITVINRLCDIFLTDKTFFPEFRSFLKESVDVITKNSTDRELLNIFNYLGTNPLYADEEVITKIIKNLQERKLQLNSMDAATLFHNLRKFSANIVPFLNLLTLEIIRKSSSLEVAILFHSLYKYETHEKISVMKEIIMKKFDELTPKHILNIAKDLVEDRNNYDKEFVERFEKKAEESFAKHNTPDSIEFRTQLISYYYLKHKNDRGLQSSSDDDH